MGIFGTSKLKLFAGDDKVKKAYLGDTKIYSAGNIVTYYVDSSTYYQKEVDSDASCLNPTTFTPYKSGWTFVGWREDKTASSSVLTSKIMGDEPITLYAVFKQAVTLYYYNGSTTKQNKSDYRYYNNGNVVNPSFVMSQTTASGWTARGWATGTAGNASVAYSNGATITISADTTIYGLYQQTITLSYYNNSTTKQTTTGTRYWNSGSNAYVNPTFTLSQASKSGWTARGWATGTAGNASVAYSSISNREFSSNTTVYGLYYKDITVTFISYNKSEEIDGTYYYNSAGNTTNPSITAPNGADYPGWTWRGWSFSGETHANAGVNFGNGFTWDGGSTHTRYGLYEQTIYLYYNGNGSTSGSVSTQSGTRYWNAYGNYSNPSFVLASNGYSRTNYTFTGWNLGAVGGTVTLSASTTAYAQWKLADITAALTAKGVWDNSPNMVTAFYGTAYDLTGVSKVTITYEYYYYDWFDSNMLKYFYNTFVATVGISANRSSFALSQSNEYGGNSYANTGSGTLTKTIDVSSLSGNYYIGCGTKGYNAYTGDRIEDSYGSMNYSTTITKVIFS